jgi:CHASE3 domain sensor protein
MNEPECTGREDFNMMRKLGEFNDALDELAKRVAELAQYGCDNPQVFAPIDVKQLLAIGEELQELNLAIKELTNGARTAIAAQNVIADHINELVQSSDDDGARKRLNALVDALNRSLCLLK